jgi:hypothetical protein
VAGEAASRWPGSLDRSGSLACRLPAGPKWLSGWCVPLAWAQAPGDHTMIHSAIYRPQSCVPSPPLGRCGHGAACIVWTIQGFLPEEPIGHYCMELNQTEVELPGGGVIHRLHSHHGERTSLHVFEQHLTNGLAFRWLCSSRPGLALAAESIVSIEPLRHNSCRFNRRMLMPAYHRSMVAALDELKPTPKNLCFIGVGGGVLPMHLAERHPKCTMTCVESDDGVLALARQYLGLRGRHMHILHTDGLHFLRVHKSLRFDAIFLDASCAPEAEGGCGLEVQSPPSSLSSRAALLMLRSHLGPEGVLLINSTGGDDAQRRALREAIVSVFDVEPLLLGTDEGNDVIVVVK